MTIQHDKPDGPVSTRVAVMFACLPGISCSVCAPRWMSAKVVESFATHQSKPFPGTEWVAVDKSTLGLGQPTPNPCEHDRRRQHWFLMSQAKVSGTYPIW